MSNYRERAVAAFAARLNASREPYSKTVLDAPFVIMEDQDEQIERVDYGYYRAAMTIHVESYDNPMTGELRSTAINRRLASLIRTAIGADLTMGGVCEDIVYTSGGPILFDTPVEAIACYADFQVAYQYPEGDPTLPLQVYPGAVILELTPLPPTI